jgi:hypothetical protein
MFGHGTGTTIILSMRQHCSCVALVFSMLLLKCGRLGVCDQCAFTSVCHRLGFDEERRVGVSTVYFGGPMRRLCVCISSILASCHRE